MLAPLIVLRALLSNVSFAIAQIAAIALASTIGIALRQLPDYALTNASDYASEMGRLRAAYEPTIGPLLGVFERLGFFRVFTSPWFVALLVLLAVSIVVCTLDRMPKIWASTAPSRVEQPDEFFAPSLPGRGTLHLAAAVPQGATAERANAAAALLRRSGWETSIAVAATTADATNSGATNTGPTIVHADRTRRSFRFTLVMHAGLVLILVGAAVSGALGYTQGILLTDGEALPVGTIGAKGTLVLQNRGFSAPRSATGTFIDFTTDLAVFIDGAQVAEQIVRVNEPLRYEGWSFHQNFFGPSAKLEVRDAVGDLLWSGDAPFTAVADGSPYATLPIPGSDAGLELQLRRNATNGSAASGSGASPETGAVVFVVASRPDPSGALAADGSPLLSPIFASVIAPGESASAPGAGFSVRLESIGSYTGIIARRDPGAPIIWLAAALIVGGLAFTLRRPRTRLWLRVTPGSREVDAALLVDRGADPVSSARTLERVAAILDGESA
ncbi:MAG: cytochrome c biogenesis protein ResB [Candidatus Limnocylindrus sp.]